MSDIELIEREDGASNAIITADVVPFGLSASPRQSASATINIQNFQTVNTHKRESRFIFHSVWIATVLGALVALIALVFGFRSDLLQRWSAAKDFYEFCQDAIMNGTNESCQNVVGKQLDSPPLGANDYFVGVSKRGVLNKVSRGTVSSYEAKLFDVIPQLMKCTILVAIAVMALFDPLARKSPEESAVMRADLENDQDFRSFSGTFGGAYDIQIMWRRRHVGFRRNHMLSFRQVVRAYLWIPLWFAVIVGGMDITLHLAGHDPRWYDPRWTAYFERFLCFLPICIFLKGRFQPWSIGTIGLHTDRKN